GNGTIRRSVRRPGDRGRRRRRSIRVGTDRGSRPGRRADVRDGFRDGFRGPPSWSEEPAETTDPGTRPSRAATCGTWGPPFSVSFLFCPSPARGFTQKTSIPGWLARSRKQVSSGSHFSPHGRAFTPSSCSPALHRRAHALAN